MPLFICQHCEHMFTDNYIHIKCPECGREALRDANPDEYSVFFTPKITALRDQYATAMTRDERNWTKILMATNSPKAGYGWRFFIMAYLIAEGDTPSSLPRDAILYHRRRIYRDTRWIFNRQLKQDREQLSAMGITEPRYIMRNDDGQPIVANWDAFGPALKILYSFEMDDAHKRPTTWEVNHIDLEKIATEPSEGYMKFLSDWADLYSDERHPMDGIFPKMNPFRLVDENEVVDDGELHS